MALNEKAVKKRIAQLQTEDNDFSQELDAYYDAALSYISKHLSAFYEHYADENGLTVTQAAQTIGKWDKTQWQMAIDELNSDNWQPESKKRAKFLGNYAGLNVGNMIAAIAGLGIIAWLDKAIKRSQKRAGNVAKGEKSFLNSYKLAAGAYNTGSIGKVLSDSIWIDGDRLIDDVRAELFKCYQTGKSLDDLRQKLIRQVKPTPGTNIADRMAQAESKVDRLIRSESAKMIDEIDTAAYKEAGVEYVNWVIEPGACSKCVSLKESGPYPIDKAPALVIDSHPNCRCAKVPSDKANLRGLGLAVGAASANIISSQENTNSNKIEPIKNNNTSNEELPKLKMRVGRQKIHYQGTLEYNNRVKAAETPGKRYGYYPSYFTSITIGELEKFVLQNATTEQLKKDFFFMDLHRPIGIYRTKCEEDQTTSRIKVLMSKDRTEFHAVPARPQSQEKHKNENNK